MIMMMMIVRKIKNKITSLSIKYFFSSYMQTLDEGLK